MKKMFPFIAIIFVGIAAYFLFFNKKKETGPSEPKQASIKLKKHTESFNKSIDSIVNNYLEIKNAFVNADTALVKKETTSFITLLNNFPITGLDNDSSNVIATVQDNVSNMLGNANSILAQTNIIEMRKDFKGLTDVMYPSFFTSINYEGEKLFVAECPMAFSDSISAIWISNSAEIMNPYLGKNHPTYKGGMLHCGELKDSILAK